MKKLFATALIVPAALALAAPAHADGLDVIFQPNIGGMVVNVSATGGYPQAQNCTYTAVSAGGLGSLVPPTVNKPFNLPPNGTANVRLPGIPTGSTWSVQINCEWAGPPLPKGPGVPLDRPSSGRFNGVQSY
jgi:hypothetical protein